jgi:hypothetical protein
MSLEIFSGSALISDCCAADDWTLDVVPLGNSSIFRSSPVSSCDYSTIQLSVDGHFAFLNVVSDDFV